MKQSEKITVSLDKIHTIESKFWTKIKSILPIQDGNKKAGRPRCNDYLIMSGIDYRLKTGCQWKKIPPYYGSSSTIHRRFQEWVKMEIFRKLWEAELIKYDNLVQLNLDYQIADGAITKAPLGGQETGKSPVDRRKIGTKRCILTDAEGIPIAITFAGANIPDIVLLEKTLSAKPLVVREEKNSKLCLDRGFDSENNRDIAVRFGYIPYGKSQHACENVCNLQFRWPIERTHSWLNRFRAIYIRWEKKLKNFESVVFYAFTKILFSKIRVLG